MSGAASAAAAVEAVLVAEDKSFNTDVAEVTAMMRAENAHEQIRKPRLD